MEALIDLFFDLLGWMIPLLGKFWPLILVLIGYQVFGKKSGRKMAQGKPRRALTPVESGGFPQSTSQEERKQVRASAKYEPVEPESMEGVGVEQEWAFAKPDHSLHIRERESIQPPAVEQEPVASSRPTMDPREGLKWAIIFGEPRAKAPHGSPAARRRNA